MKTRQDAWSEENDVLLAETVLKHVRAGSTQLNAFEEVGDILSRTSAACGFRWNAVVRHQYEQALKLARKYWKDKQRASDNVQRTKKPLYEPTALVEFADEPIAVATATSVHPNLAMADVISFLQSYATMGNNSQSLAVENEQLRKQNELFKEKNKDLELKIAKLEQDAHFIQEDYETLMRIMNRARTQVLFGEEEQHSPTFKMDKNGNLERIAE